MLKLASLSLVALLTIASPASATPPAKAACLPPSQFANGVRVEGKLLIKFREQVAPGLPAEVDLVLIHPSGTIAIAFVKGCAVSYTRFDEQKPKSKDDGSI